MKGSPAFNKDNKALFFDIDEKMPSSSNILNKNQNGHERVSASRENLPQR